MDNILFYRCDIIQACGREDMVARVEQNISKAENDGMVKLKNFRRKIRGMIFLLKYFFF